MRRLAAHWLPVEAAGVFHFEILMVIITDSGYEKVPFENRK
jgi:hypothetical protein